MKINIRKSSIKDLKKIDITTKQKIHNKILSLIDFPDIIESAAKEYAPHLIAFYLRDLASEFHSYYNATRFLVPEIPIRLARLALIASTRQVLCNGLVLLGVSAPEKM